MVVGSLNVWPLPWFYHAEACGQEAASVSKSGITVGTWVTRFCGHNPTTRVYARNKRTRVRKLVMNDALADAAVIPTAYTGMEKKIGETAASSWLHIVPWGMFKLMKHVQEKYGNPPVFTTENGVDDADNRFSRLENALQDDNRIQYHNDYMSSLLDATRKEGCNVQGYFVWSLLLDNWEWNSGYTVRFGLYYVDYNNNLEASAEWFSQILLIPEGRCLVDVRVQWFFSHLFFLSVPFSHHFGCS